MTDTVITKEQIRNLILAEKIRPSDLFGVEVLTEDPVVKGFVDDQKRHATAGEYAHRKRTEEGFDKARKELEDQLKAKDGEIGKYRMEAAKLKVRELFATERTKRNLNERQAKFVEKRLSRFAPSKLDELEKEFGSFLDTEIDEYGRLAKEVFGVEDGKDTGGKDKKSSGAEPDASKPEPKGAEKYLNPATNPFIKTT